MIDYDFIIFASYGNDSISLIQFMKNKYGTSKNIAVLFSDTGWAAEYWEERVLLGEALANKYGFDTYRTKSGGMEALVRRKKGWPMGGGAAFCTAELKVIPALEWMDKYDPSGEAICCVGIRREESANRANFPEHVEESEKHGGRSLWAPLVRHLKRERDNLLHEAGFEPLPSRSKECFPCVHANINDLRQLSEERIIYIENVENDMGINSKGNPRVMFRPKRHQGAIGIRAVVDWAVNRRHRDQMDMFSCDGGYCE